MVVLWPCRICLTVSLYLTGMAHAESGPRLSSLGIKGLLPTNKFMDVPFFPPFRFDGSTDDFKCELDHSMSIFTLVVEAQPPGVLSLLLRDGRPITSVGDLARSHLEPGERTVYTIAVMEGETREYTLVVERRSGISLEILGLRPLTAEGKVFTIPYHPSELQSEFKALQSFHEDTFVVEYDFSDGGQEIDCTVIGRRNIGPDIPSEGQMSVHPDTYKPALEQLHGITEDRVFNLNSPGAGPTASCRVPIDTWREVTVQIHIRAADKVSERSIRILVTRKGCERHSFYHKGLCLKHCPSDYYEQHFNWRCGSCSEHCEFCKHWHKCIKCRPNTLQYRNELMSNGTCQQIRIHAYKVYYRLARYLAASCASLLTLYILICVSCLCRRLTADDKVKESLDASEERRPLTAPPRGVPRSKPVLGAAGLLDPAE